MLVTRAGGRRPYVLRVMRAPRTGRFLTGLGVAAVIHVHDLAAARVPEKTLVMSAFGLTGREADLGVSLVRCAGLAAAAADAGMALNTARNHLQGIFRKSGTASQAEAVQLFSRLT
jgi:DNA-binding CsgD family transcriptional regulator